MDFGSKSVLPQADVESMNGELIMVMLVEDHLDHAELVIHTLEHRYYFRGRERPGAGL